MVLRAPGVVTNKHVCYFHGGHAMSPAKLVAAKTRCSGCSLYVIVHDRKQNSHATPTAFRLLAIFAVVAAALALCWMWWTSRRSAQSKAPRGEEKDGLVWSTKDAGLSDRIGAQLETPPQPTFWDRMVDKISSTFRGVEAARKTSVDEMEAARSQLFNRTGAKLKETHDKAGQLVDQTGTRIKETVDQTGMTLKERADQAGANLKEAADQTGAKIKETHDKAGVPTDGLVDMIGAKLRQGASPKLREGGSPKQPAQPQAADPGVDTRDKAGTPVDGLVDMIGAKLRRDSNKEKPPLKASQLITGDREAKRRSNLHEMAADLAGPRSMM